MACATQEEIAEAVEVSQPTVVGWQDDFIKNSTSEDFINSRDFDPPIYNIWKQQAKSNSVSHFGNSEPRWVENLLYLYTQPVLGKRKNMSPTTTTSARRGFRRGCASPCESVRLFHVK